MLPNALTRVLVVVELSHNFVLRLFLDSRELLVLDQNSEDSLSSAVEKIICYRKRNSTFQTDEKRNSQQRK